MDIGMKSFVSEDELAKVKRIKQEQWELKRKPDDPLECPEEEFDNRTLYERLKEQRDKKQEEFDESRKLKHCIKLLDNDEVEFLEQVDELKIKEMMNKLDEEKKAIEEFKSHVSNLSKLEQEKKINEFKRSLFGKSNTVKESPNQLAGTTTRRQAKLLANAVKRKPDKDNEDDKNSKKFKSNDNTDQSSSGDKKDDDDKNNKDDDDKDKDDKDNNEQNNDKIVLVEQKQPSALKILGVLPGLSSYDSDTSDSENSDSSDNEINTKEIDDYLLVSRKGL